LLAPNSQGYFLFMMRLRSGLVTSFTEFAWALR
jgi:hypothetical protein